MDEVNVNYSESGKTTLIKIENKALMCPFCKNAIVPKYIYAFKNRSNDYDVFCKCTYSDCAKSFISLFVPNGYVIIFSKILPTFQPETKKINNVISTLSSEFVEIYNQSFIAEQSNLNQIAGTGYRKALEFLIKDYLISILPEEKHEDIKKKFLNNCIREDVQNVNVKNVAARAVWLGNDETHYIRKWEDKDVHDLKALIDLTLHWIESEIQTKNLLEDMPEFK